MDDLTVFIGRQKIPRGEDTKRLYELEEQTCECLRSASHELRRFLSARLSEDEAIRFSIAEELFVLLDVFRPDSIQAATAFLSRYGRHVIDNTSVPGDSTPSQ